MSGRIAAIVLVAFASTSAYASHHGSGGRSSGGHASGGHASGGHSSGGHYSGQSSGRYSSGGQAAYRGSSGGHPSGGGSGLSVAQRRHPRAGYGSGSHHGYYGHGHDGHHHYSGYYGHYGYYPYYPYYGAYGYYPYGWGYGGLGIGLYYSNGYRAPVYGYAAPDDSYAGDPGEQVDDDAYPDRDARSDEDRTEAGELRLIVRPDDASVYVDGRLRGMARRLETLWLEPGRHHIEVVRPGFRVAERDVDIGPRARVSLLVELERP